MKLTPAQDFVKSDLIRGWLDYVAAPQFQNASKAAMLEFSRRIAGKPEAGLMLAGAHDFLDVLMSLGESKPNPTRNDTINLTHR